jgi:hypothetical protein
MNAGALRRARPVALVLMLIAGAAPSPASTALRSAQQTTAMKIQLDLDGTQAMATLDDSAATRDFVSLLPLTLTLADYNGTEKISDLPTKLSTKGAPAGVEPAAGDIAYYAPWGNLAIFYKDFSYSSGLVKLGQIHSNGHAFDRPGTLRVTIARIEE